MATKSTLILFLLLGFGGFTLAQSISARKENEFQRELRFKSNTAPLVVVRNVAGNVRVEGHDGNTVILEARETLSAKSDRKLEDATNEVRLVTKVVDDVILIYPQTPDTEAHLKGRTLDYKIDRCNDSYRFRYDLFIRVPRQVSLDASTVNDGEVYAKDVNGDKILLSNVNGAVRAEDIPGLEKASNINGPISISYASQPNRDASFNTVNGKIEVRLPQDLQANVHFKSTNGDLYTDYENVSIGPRYTKSNRKRGQHTTYKLDQATVMKINGGGPTLDFDVLNGNVYVKKY